MKGGGGDKFHALPNFHRVKTVYSQDIELKIFRLIDPFIIFVDFSRKSLSDRHFGHLK
jgi:hypothetical protein